MALVLDEENVLAKKVRKGQAIVKVAALDHFRLRAGNDDLFFEAVPQGKKWTVYVRLEIEERDV